MGFYACEKCGGAGFTGLFWWAKECKRCKGTGHEPPPKAARLVSPPPPRPISYCTKCGRRKSYLDSSPCGGCVAVMVAEVQQRAEECLRLAKEREQQCEPT